MNVLTWTADLGCWVISPIGVDFVASRMCYASAGREIFAVAIWAILMIVAAMAMARPA